MVASGTGKCLGWLYPVLLSSPNVHTVDCASFQALRSQHSPSRLFFLGSTTILNCNLFPSVHPSPATHPMKTSLILPRTSNHLIFYKLFGGNFCEQPLVLEKLSEMVYLLGKSHLCAHHHWLVIVY